MSKAIPTRYQQCSALKPIPYRVGKKVFFLPDRRGQGFFPSQKEEYYVVGIAQRKCGTNHSVPCMLKLCNSSTRWITLNPHTFELDEMCVEYNPSFVDGEEE